MTTERSVASEVTVGVSPQAAFRAFTEDIDLWWVRGPINFFDGARAVAMVCEPGVGGRILEVYDRAAGEALELGRITVWQPGELVAWRSSVDDVLVEVSFTPAGPGTRVRVVATIPPGGQDKGGSFWTRVVPDWLGRWCERLSAGPAPTTLAGTEPDEIERLGVAVYYARPLVAAHWLADAFGLVPTRSLPPADPDREPERTWIEFRVGRCSLMLFPADPEQPAAGGPTHVPWIYVDDLDAHLTRARQAGATVVEPIRQHGFRVYVASDPEGRRWTFAQARPTMR